MPFTSQGASQQLVPGVYVNVLPPLQALNPYINTTLNGFVGGANWGKPNTPIFVSDGPSILAAVGNDTIGAGSGGINVSLVQEALMALNEDGNSVLVRQTDGTDTAAFIDMLDASAGVVIILTAAETGSLPNGNPATNTPAAGSRFDLVAPNVYRLSIFFPGQAPIVYPSIPAGAPAGSYSASAFQANVLAQVNGTAPNSTPNPYFIASAGSSVIAPVVGTVYSVPISGSGAGSDGTSGLTFATLIGTDSQTGARTGIYALRGTDAFQIAICGLTDLSKVATLSAFCTSEGIALGFATVPKGTSDSSAVGLRQTNAVVYGNIVLVKDFVYTYDSIFQTYRYVSPIGKAMGIVGLCPPYVSPINMPWNITGNTAANVLSTEQTPLGPRSTDEIAYLITNGFICITNQMPINNDSYGIAWDVTSTGAPNANNGAGFFIPVERMNVFLAQAFNDIGGGLVGGNQSIAPNDDFRETAFAAYNNFLTNLQPPGGQNQIDGFEVTCDLTNNTLQTIAAGICYVKILVRYLGVVRILYVTLQGGTNVIVSNTAPQLNIAA